MDLKLDHGSSSSILDQAKSSSEDKESSSPKASDKEEEDDEEEEGGTSGSQDNNNKPLKKPTKILPCPRCNSTETKFCYFNNYNVNQPRHFCKKCQRYWTAGGTMRSMVIGAGRRKNKNSSCLNPQPFVIPNALPDSSIESRKTDNVSFQSFATLWPNPAFAVPVYAVPPFWYSHAALRPDSQLGKHPRDGNQLEISNEEGKRAEITKVLVPKTLRFDDPSEAAKSSIWTTLGIKNEKIRSLDSGAFFGGFASKGGEMNSTKLSTSRLLQANPAALSRSFTFHECA